MLEKSLKILKQKQEKHISNLKSKIEESKSKPYCAKSEFHTPTLEHCLENAELTLSEITSEFSLKIKHHTSLVKNIKNQINTNFGIEDLFEINQLIIDLGI